MNKKPICFVAHNGNRFDFPILRTEIEKTGNCLPDDILCVDSLVAFRNIDQHKESEKRIVPKDDIPFDFNDGFDEALCQAVDEYEKQCKLKPEEVQKINETTPKKQMISLQPRIGASSSVPKRNFSRVR